MIKGVVLQLQVFLLVIKRLDVINNASSSARILIEVFAYIESNLRSHFPLLLEYVVFRPFFRLIFWSDLNNDFEVRPCERKLEIELDWVKKNFCHLFSFTMQFTASVAMNEIGKSALISVVFPIVVLVCRRFRTNKMNWFTINVCGTTTVVSRIMLFMSVTSMVGTFTGPSCHAETF